MCPWDRRDYWAKTFSCHLDSLFEACGAEILMQWNILFDHPLWDTLEEMT